MNHFEIDQAIESVREMKALVLDRQRFQGFSGVARMIGGFAALATSLVLQHLIPPVPKLHLIGWGSLLAVGLTVNFAALAYWLYKRWNALRFDELWPVWEVFPTLSVGAALTVALVRSGQLDLLFGAWMALYGASHMVHRRSLPFPIYCGGLVYLGAGIFFLLWPHASFTDPRPMGLVFGLGELFGGWVLVKGRN